MHKVLVPFDGSEVALRAVRYAIKIAKENGPVAIHLVTAREAAYVYGDIAAYVAPEKIADMQLAHCTAVLEPAEKLLDEAAVSYTKEILAGPIAEVIARSADTSHCDSIIMGTHGRSAVGGLLLGSVATKVIHLAHVPVTLVK